MLPVILEVVFQVKDGNQVSGKGRVRCPLYEEIDNILGNLAASCPPVVVESGDGDIEVNNNASPLVEDDNGMSLSFIVTTRNYCLYIIRCLWSSCTPFPSR